MIRFRSIDFRQIFFPFWGKKKLRVTKIVRLSIFFGQKLSFVRCDFQVFGSVQCAIKHYYCKIQFLVQNSIFSPKLAFFSFDVKVA